MPRLIDADNLAIPNDAAYKASVKRVIAQQPVAYDVDAVLEELKKLDKYHDRIINLGEVIRIVKAGGKYE